MKKKIIAVSFVTLILGAAFSGAALAQGEPPPREIPSVVASANEFINILNNIVDWLFVVVMIGAVIFIVLAGWQFISAGGDPQGVAQARSKLLYAAIGIIVAVLSQGIVAAVEALVGTGGGGAPPAP